MTKYNWLRSVTFIVISIFTVSSIASQENRSDNKWHLNLDPYLMLSYMHGKTGTGSLPNMKFKQSAEDIFNNLKIGGMLYGEVYKGPWTISSDIIYAKLGSDVSGWKESLTGDVTIKQLNWEVAGMYRVTSWLDAGLAAQLNSLRASADILVSNENMNIPLSAKSSKTWVDPSIITRVYFPLGENDKWSFLFRGNIGGFGVGSDFYWQIQPQFGYRFTKVFQLSAGYRAMSVDYEKGKGKSRFLYDTVTHGPFVKLGFSVF